MKTDVVEPAPPVRTAAAKPGKKRTLKFALLGLAAVLLLGGGFFAWQMFFAEPEKPAPKQNQAKAPVPPQKAPATVATNTPPGTPPGAPATATTTTTPASTNTTTSIAQAPKAAIDKAKAAVAKNDARQANMPETADDLANKPATPPSPANNTVKASPVTTTVQPGVTATTAESDVLAVPTASGPFKAYVTSARITGAAHVNGVSRATINGRTFRAGETVDGTLGITFEGYDATSRQLTFKDKSGATVVRKW